MTEVVSKSRLLWACRRGMLELDTLFLPFVNEAFDHLSDPDKEIFQRLLSCDDGQLFAWFMGRQTCPDASLLRMIDVIRNHIKV